MSASWAAEEGGILLQVEVFYVDLGDGVGAMKPCLKYESRVKSTV